MPNNSPRRKFAAVNWLVDIITGSMGGIWGAIAAPFLRYIINDLARRGIYFLDVSSAIVKTNMDEQTWLETVADSYEKIEQGNITPEQGEAIDRAYKAAFRNFVVFKRVKRQQ